RTPFKQRWVIVSDKFLSLDLILFLYSLLLTVIVSRTLVEKSVKKISTKQIILNLVRISIVNPFFHFFRKDFVVYINPFFKPRTFLLSIIHSLLIFR